MQELRFSPVEARYLESVARECKRLELESERIQAEVARRCSDLMTQAYRAIMEGHGIPWPEAEFVPKVEVDRQGLPVVARWGEAERITGPVDSEPGETGFVMPDSGQPAPVPSRTAPRLGGSASIGSLLTGSPDNSMRDSVELVSTP